jgi:hypothetical protein
MVAQLVVAAAAEVLTASAAMLRRSIAEGLLAEDLLVVAEQDQLMHILAVVVEVRARLEPPRQLAALVGQVGRRQSREPL